MSLSRSPSPIPGGGWSSPGLNINSGRTSPAHIPSSGGPSSPGGPWGSASRMRSNHNLNGYPSFSTQNSGFFVRHMRRISSSLPRFYNSEPASGPYPYGYKDKGPRAWAPRSTSWAGRLRSIFNRMGKRSKGRLLAAAIVLFILLIFYNSRTSALLRAHIQQQPQAPERKTPC